MEKASSLIVSNQDRLVSGRIAMTPGTMGTVMHAIAIKFFGTDIYDWEPETIAMEFQDEFGVKPDEDNIEKLCAILSSVSSDAFYEDWVAYIKVCSVLSGENDIEDLVDVTVEELAWGVMEVSLNDDDFSKSKFSPDVATLTGVVLDDNGYTHAPPQLSFAKLPERYRGSDFGPDIKNDARYSNYNAGLLAEYLHDQVVTIYQQIKALPWLEENDFKMIIQTATQQLNLARQ
jgi:hypothetical protein